MNNKIIYSETINKWNGKAKIRRRGLYAILDATEHDNLFYAPLYYYNDGAYIEADEDACYLSAMADGYAVVCEYRTRSGAVRRELLNAERLLQSEKDFLLGL